MDRNVSAILCAIMVSLGGGLFAAPNLFSVSPYVQHPTADGMTILFFTTADCAATVKCWPVAEAATVRTSPTGQHFTVAAQSAVVKKRIVIPSAVGCCTYGETENRFGAANRPPPRPTMIAHKMADAFRSI